MKLRASTVQSAGLGRLEPQIWISRYRNPQSSAVNDSLSMITADAAADLGVAVSSHSENNEDMTNEPEIEERVFIAKPSGTLEVAANSPSIRDLTVRVRSFQGRNADTEMDLGRAMCPQIETPRM
jgi:hypothetical protein